MMWVIVVLLPKGGGDFQGIGLLEPFWKVLEVIMDNRLQVIEFHDCLHGFVKGKGCGAKFRIKLLPGPKTEGEELFEELRATIERPLARENSKNSWISASTWKLVDTRAQLKSRGVYNMPAAGG